MKLFRMWAFLVFFSCLVLPPWVFGAESIILVSGMENTFGTSPGIESCILWRLDEKAKKLEKIVEIDKQYGMRRISAFPEEHLLVTWVYKPWKYLKDEEGKVLYRGGSPVVNERKGLAVIVDINKPNQIRQVELPFQPIFSGWLAHSKDGKVSVISMGPKEYGGYKSIVYSLDTGKVLPNISKANIPWDDIRLYGSNLIRKNQWILSFEMDDSGALLYQVGNKEKVPTKMIKIPPDRIEDFLSRFYKPIPMAVNTDRVRVLSSWEKTEQPDKWLCLIYNKQKEEWNEFWLNAPASATQAFGKYLVFNIGTKVPSSVYDIKHKRRDMTTINTGDFIFYNIETGKHWEQHLGDTCEILAIWEDNILYRKGDVLYRASISADHLDEPVRVLSDSVLMNVHWAFVRGGFQGQQG